MKLNIDNILIYCLATYFISHLADSKNNSTSNFLTVERQVNKEIELENEFILSDYEYFDKYKFSYILIIL